MMKIFLFLLLISLFTVDLYSGPQHKIETLNFDEFEKKWLVNDDNNIYVINFWATWCAPCVREIPAFEKIHSDYKDKNVKVLLVSLDFPNQLESRLIPFIENHNVQSKVILLDDTNSNRWIPLVDESWNGAIPATVIYSSGFREFYRKEFKYDELESIIKPLIN